MSWLLSSTTSPTPDRCQPQLDQSATKLLALDDVYFQAC
jgi:hypothetical protein